MNKNIGFIMDHKIFYCLLIRNLIFLNYFIWKISRRNCKLRQKYTRQIIL